MARIAGVNIPNQQHAEIALTAIYGIGRELLAQREPKHVIRAIHTAIVENLKPDHACVLAVRSEGYRALIQGLGLRR